MTPHVRAALDDPSGVAEARRRAVAVARDAGFDDTAAGRVALVVTELATNVVRHAKRGELLVARCDVAGGAGVEVLALDRGPGMADVRACLRDGYSTGGSAGTGLGAVERLADVFSLFSRPGDGTVIAARVAAAPSPYGRAPPPRFSVGAVCLAAPGETVSGDGWSFRCADAGAGLIVADGLGHGPLAAHAAQAAIDVFDGDPTGSPADVLGRAHAALRSTRGAAVAMVTLDDDERRVVFCGAGNVAGRIVSGVDDRGMMSQQGTVGLQVRRLVDVPYAWPDHAIVVLHSDGLKTRWSLPRGDGLLQCHPSVIAGWIVRDHLRGNDDATVVVVRRGTP